MKVDVIQLMEFFDEMTPLTEEEQGMYWFKTRRPDGITITLALSIYESSEDLIVQTKDQTDVTGISMKNCSEIRIVDAKRKCLEITHDSLLNRCFLSLLEGTILKYEE